MGEVGGRWLISVSDLHVHRRVWNLMFYCLVSFILVPYITFSSGSWSSRRIRRPRSRLPASRVLCPCVRDSSSHSCWTPMRHCEGPKTPYQGSTRGMIFLWSASGIHTQVKGHMRTTSLRHLRDEWRLPIQQGLGMWTESTDVQFWPSLKPFGA